MKIKIFLLFFLVWTLSGCQLKDSKGPVGSESQASFYIEIFEGDFTVNNSEDSNARTLNWGLTENLRYNFKACVLNYLDNSPIPGHRFVISQSSGSYEAVSDSEGCLTWYKDYHLNFFGESEYFEEVFTIQSQGLHQGQVQLRAALNPRAQLHGLTLKPFVDLRKESVGFLVEEKHKQELLAGNYTRPGRTPWEPQLYMDMAFFTFKNGFPAEQGLEMEVLFQGEMKLRLRNPEGTPFTIPLPQGRVNLFTTLVAHSDHDDQNEIQVLAQTDSDTLSPACGSASPSSGRIENGSLQSEFNIRVHDFPKQGRLDFYVLLTPDPCLAGVPSVRPLRGYFTLGDVKDFKTGYRSVLQTNPNYLSQIESAIERHTLGLGGTGEDPDGSNRRPVDAYQFSVLSIRYGGVVRETETATQRTVRMQLSTRAQDPLLYRPIRNRVFHVYALPPYPAGEEPPAIGDLNSHSYVPVTTDEEGFLRWNDSLGHIFYQTERFFIKTYVLLDPETQARSTLRAVVNPWNNGWLFARDFREVTPSDLVEHNLSAPRVFMNNYGMQSRSTYYEIDNFLRLHTIRSYNFSMQPWIVRHDSLSEGLFGHHNLRDGFYLVRLALIKNFQSEEIRPELFVNSWEKVVRVRAGYIITPMEFSIQDLTLMGARNRLAVELLTIHEDAVHFLPGQEHLPRYEREIDQQRTLAEPDLIYEDSGLKMPSFSAPFIPLHESQSANFIEMQSMTTSEIIEMGREIQAAREDYFAEAHNMQNFDRRNRLKLLELSNPEHVDWLRLHTRTTREEMIEQIHQLFEEGPRLQGLDYSMNMRFCSVWTNFLLPEMLGQYRRENQEQNLDVEGLSDEQMLFMNHLLMRQCEAATADQKSVFKFDRKYIGGEVLPESIQYMGGRSFNYTVSSNFSLSKGYGFDVRQSHASDLSFSAGVGIDIPVIDLNVGARRSETFSAGESRSFNMGGSNSISYGAGAYLVVQESNLRFDLANYKRCAVIKPKAAFMREVFELPLSHLYPDADADDSGGFWSIFDFLETEDDQEIARVRDAFGPGPLLDLMETGIRICESEIQTEPLHAQETYYYVTQHFTTGDMQDPLDRKNRPWLLEIRSARDFRVFLESIALHNELNQVGDLSRNPVDVLAESYAYFNERLPSWPGVYSSYNYDPFYEDDCDASQNVFDQLLNSTVEIITGPFQLKDGFGGLDFWEVYYCQDRRNN